MHAVSLPGHPDTGAPERPRRRYPRILTGLSAGALLIGVTHTVAMAETNPPEITLHFPNGGESLQGGDNYQIIYVATDDTFVAEIDAYYRDGAAEPWKPIALGEPNTGALYWWVPNTPTTGARIRLVARDPYGNEGEDESDADFTILQETGGTVLTTLRDFEMPGTQPLEGGDFLQNVNCLACHYGYDRPVDPGSTYLGTMMSQAMRDPIFHAALAIAEQDAVSSGDMCLRCHTPNGWLGGRSTPTDGGQLEEEDFDGITCHVCHRFVDPQYEPGVSPSVDLDILNNVDVPSDFGNGMFVTDPQDRRRGPYGNVGAPHAWLESPFHRESDLCGTCHDVSNPVFERVAGAKYAPGPLDTPASDTGAHTLMPVERTYSEWLASEFVNGVYAPEFAGVKPDGMVSSCQDCHMADAVGKGCGMESAPVRDDLPVHDLTGGNTWVPKLIAQIYGTDLDTLALHESAARAELMLQKSAILGVVAAPEGDSLRVEVTVTNRTGHKLPTGYPEGRRIWLNVQGYDAADQLTYESGAYDPATGTLTLDNDVVVYETKPGLSPGLASSLALPAGPSFHFVLNDTIYKDNRIPPLGFTNAGFDAFGGAPVDSDWPGPGPRYADGQSWDASVYRVPPSTETLVTTLYYQTISKEYVEFLRDENVTDGAGQTLHDLWTANGRAAPVAMARDTSGVVVGVPGDLAGWVQPPLQVSGPNPFHGALELRLDISTPADVRMEVFDVQGRRVADIDFGRLGGGAHKLGWDGRDGSGRDAGAGFFFVRVHAGVRSVVQRVVRVR